METFVVAVSGGVDSVVLLDMLAKKRVTGPWAENPRLVVAHFDHGIRADSADDERFVGELAGSYGLKYESQREELGEQASEAFARERRYAFLNEVASRHHGRIVTAHHSDDVIETIAINLTRGTGWRGLAVLDDPQLVRPLLGVTKAELRAYAKDHHLTWREDSTNQDPRYLRNRLRRDLAGLDSDAKEQLVNHWRMQKQLKQLIDTEAARLLPQTESYSRYFFTACGDKAADELLRMLFVRMTGVSPLPGRRGRALMAIKTAKAGTTHVITDQLRLRIGRTDFVVQTNP